jgi:hypothetical protein
MHDKPKFRQCADRIVMVTVGTRSFVVNPTLVLPQNWESLRSIIAGETDDHRQPWWGEIDTYSELDSYLRSIGL